MYTEADLAFLSELSDNANNTSEWVKANRARYDALIASQRSFITSVGEAMSDLSGFQAIPKTNKSMMRMNRDTRFSKDKRPYKDHNDSWFWVGDNKKGAPGFFFRMKGASASVGLGLYSFDKAQLASYRAAVADDGSGAALVSVLRDGGEAGYTLSGEATKRVPRGYPADHPRADLLKHKGLHLGLDVGPVPPVLLGDDASAWVAGHFRAMMPLHDWLAEVL